MRLIAIEEHILPTSARDAWKAARPPLDPVSAIADSGVVGERLNDLGEGRIALMDEQGVDVRELSLTTPSLHNLDPGPAVDIARRVNDLIAATFARRPDRFKALLRCPRPIPRPRRASWNAPSATSA